MGDFYGTGIEIWAGFGPVSNTEKKCWGPIMSNFWGRFFLCLGSKKFLNFFFKTLKNFIKISLKIFF